MLQRRAARAGRCLCRIPAVVLAVLVAGVTTAAAGDARGAAVQRYDLGACIRAALGNSPDLGAVAADLALARARLAEARAGRYGRGELNQVLGFVNQARGTVNDPNPNDERNDVFNGLGPFTRLDLAINIPLWTFGKLDAALAAAQAGIDSEVARSEVRRAEVVLRTKQLYYGLLLSRQLTLVLRDMLDTMDKAVRRTQERLDDDATGVTEIDLLQLKASRAKFAKGVLDVEAAAHLTRSALARAVGAPFDDFDIADTRLTPADAVIAPLDDYLAAGPGRRPETRQLLGGIAAQTATVKLTRADYFPSLFFATGVQYARADNRDEQTNPFAEDDFNFVRPVGVVGIHWDLNFFATSAKLDAARADLERLHAMQREAASGMELEIRRAYSDVVQARETIAATEDGRKAGRALLILTVSNFDLGLGAPEELFKGLGIYTEASSDHLRALHDYNVAVATLSKAVGQELAGLDY